MVGEMIFQFDESKEIDVTLVGRAAIDFNPIDTNKPLNKSEVFRKYLGGSPANIAVGLAKMNNKVSFLGKISKDQFGKFIKDYFKKHNIDVTGLKTTKNEEKTGLTFTEINGESSSILMYRNMAVDLAYEMQDIEEDLIKKSKIIVISGTSLAASPSREATLKILNLAIKYNCFIIFDIDYRPYTWIKEDVEIYYNLVAEKSNLIIGSIEEYNLLNDFKNEIEIKNHFLNKKAELVIIKNGKHGSNAYLKNKTYHVNIFNVKLLKSFGGGDAYASALINGMLKKHDLKKCLLYATAHASMLVSSHSCSEDTKKEFEIKEFIERYENEEIVVEIC